VTNAKHKWGIHNERRAYAQRKFPKKGRCNPKKRGEKTFTRRVGRGVTREKDVKREAPKGRFNRKEGRTLPITRDAASTEERTESHTDRVIITRKIKEQGRIRTLDYRERTKILSGVDRQPRQGGRKNPAQRERGHPSTAVHRGVQWEGREDAQS